MEFDETDMIGMWISFLYRYNQIFINQQLKKFNIGGGQFIFLLVLFQHDGINQEEISKISLIDKGTTAVAMKKLLKEGYIVVTKNENDRRSYKIFITEKARSIEKDFKKALSKWTDILTENFTENDKKASSNYLKRMYENAADVLINEKGNNK